MGEAIHGFFPFIGFRYFTETNYEGKKRIKFSESSSTESNNILKEEEEVQLQVKPQMKLVRSNESSHDEQFHRTQMVETIRSPEEGHHMKLQLIDTTQRPTLEKSTMFSDMMISREGTLEIKDDYDVEEEVETSQTHPTNNVIENLLNNGKKEEDKKCNNESFGCDVQKEEEETPDSLSSALSETILNPVRREENEKRNDESIGCEGHKEEEACSPGIINDDLFDKSKKEEEKLNGLISCNVLDEKEDISREVPTSIENENLFDNKQENLLEKNDKELKATSENECTILTNIVNLDHEEKEIGVVASETDNDVQMISEQIPEICITSTQELRETTMSESRSPNANKNYQVVDDDGDDDIFNYVSLQERVAKMSPMVVKEEDVPSQSTVSVCSQESPVSSSSSASVNLNLKFLKNINDPNDVKLGNLGGKDGWWPIRRISTLTGLSERTQLDLKKNKLMKNDFEVKANVFAQIQPGDLLWHIYRLTQKQIKPFSSQVESKKLKPERREELLEALKIAEEMIQVAIIKKKSMEPTGPILATIAETEEENRVTVPHIPSAEELQEQPIIPVAFKPGLKIYIPKQSIQEEKVNIVIHEIDKEHNVTLSDSSMLIDDLFISAGDNRFCHRFGDLKEISTFEVGVYGEDLAKKLGKITASMYETAQEQFPEFTHMISGVVSNNSNHS